ncbi:RNA polymerase sigma factor [Streptomyces sp. NPDC001930]|uniref:RNA polymerase sigma factor n=1 Tax=Streptomyces sp. NPDC001930 TaxID=3364625 RepID=UPI00369C40D5
MSSDEAKGMIPHQREPLGPEAQKQWDRMRLSAGSVRRRIYSRTGLPAWEVDDIEAKAWESIYRRLRLSGPLDDKVEAYLFAVVAQKVGEHLAELAQRAAKIVDGGDEILLRQPCPGPEEQSLADLAPALKVLRRSMTEFQLRAFVLAEAYGMKAPFIAEALGGTATAGSVRDALRHARRKRALLFGDVAGD